MKVCVCVLSVCVCIAGQENRSVGGKINFSEKIVSIIGACPRTEKYLQGGMGEIMGAVNEKCGGASDGVIDGVLTRGNC